MATKLGVFNTPPKQKAWVAGGQANAPGDFQAGWDGMEPGIGFTGQTPASTPSGTGTNPSTMNPPTGGNFPSTGGDLTVGGNSGSGGGSAGNGTFDSSSFNLGGVGGNLFKSVYDQAGNTINEYNTAANRLRERTDSMTKSNMNAVTGRNLGRGFGFSGIQDAGVAGARYQGQNAYAQGLGNLSDKFETQRQEGLKTQLGAATGLMNNANFLDNIRNLFGMNAANNATSRANTKDNNAAEMSRQKNSQTFQAGQVDNASARAFYQKMVEMGLIPGGN